ncbi:RodZ domain-containing protein [Denitratisoma oestradiolicum]|uniref:Cytoskeleton protein RodZ-like C-terminal domain-containing protein n=1 Tax=Denitratisoma oestradiolicum TaxID=311182 RepID=A0A6S6Y0F2_9PROT|nr:RodZ domain-containing protein [Denitratisoma oestradiolicum]TWO78998.1 hypothetical protein CBW56_17145 [Denitratisoma oestradiolicum]CAB1369955.1 conserved protein of unknown function [Denitratisoma oestradiolicum]
MSEQSLDADAGPELPPVPETIPVQLPGARLRQAREGMGMGIDDVAQILKFSHRQIEALERDDYQVLQGATFVRGFVRVYAKLLKLDAGDLLSRLDTEVPVTQAEIAAPCNMGDAAPEAFVERNQRALIIGLLFLVVAVVAGYLYTRRDVGAPEGTVPLSSVANPAVEAMPPPMESQVPVTVSSPVEPVSPDTAAAAPLPMQSAAAVAAAPALVFDFDDISWLEVKDATQRIILTGEFPKGSHQTVSGRPPYQLWIGKASGVRVVYGDRKVDLQPHTRDAVARLTLD